MHLSARQFEARHFADRHLQLTAGSVAAAPDPYAWFPGDRGPAPPTSGKRYEEYATEPRKRRRGPQRIPRALRQSLQAAEAPPLETPLPFTPVAPIAPPQPLELPPPVPHFGTDSGSAPRTAAAGPEVDPAAAAVDPAAGADWTAYAHLPPLDPAEEADELQVLSQLLRGKRR